MMKLSSFRLIALALPIAASTLRQSIHSQSQYGLNTDGMRELVPGDNPVYYTRIHSKSQLFSIEDFTVSSYPAVFNSRVFLYLRGFVYKYPGLENSTIQFLGTCPLVQPEPIWNETSRLDEWDPIVIRKYDYIEDKSTWGGPLTGGTNDILAYTVPIWLGFKPPKHPICCTFEAVAKLPDDRILFSFGAETSLVHPGNVDQECGGLDPEVFAGGAVRFESSSSASY